MSRPPTLTRPLAEDTRAGDRSSFVHPLDRPDWKPEPSALDLLYPERHNELPVVRMHSKAGRRE